MGAAQERLSNQVTEDQHIKTTTNNESKVINILVKNEGTFLKANLKNFSEHGR